MVERGSNERGWLRESYLFVFISSLISQLVLWAVEMNPHRPIPGGYKIKSPDKLCWVARNEMPA